MIFRLTAEKKSVRFEENHEDQGAKHIRQRGTAKKVSFG